MSGIDIGFRCVCFEGEFEKNNYDITITSGKINDEYSDNLHGKTILLGLLLLFWDVRVMFERKIISRGHAPRNLL